MKLDLIIGPMFSGKSTELIRRINIAKMISNHVFVVSHVSDTRYAKGKICTHNHVTEYCHSHSELKPFLNDPQFIKATHVFIEEGQFFKDLEDFVIEAVEGYKKQVTVSALDGTYQRKPFMNVLNLVPFADHVTRLQAICVHCKDGTPAPFSKRITNIDAPDILVGGAKEYESVCRKHFISA